MKRSKNKEVKKRVLLDIIFTQLDKGKSPKEICKDLNISKQSLQYYLSKLKSNGYIKKIGYGVWQTSKNRVASLTRGHAFMWHLRLPKEIKVWDKILTKKKIPFKSINNNHTHQIYFRDNKIWLSKNSIVIYDINSYFGINAVYSKKLAFFALRSLLNSLQGALGVNLQTNSQYIVKTSRQHYALVKNCMAMQYDKEGKKLNVYNDKGLWFTIDSSYNLSEAETVHPETSLVDSLGIQKYFNEHKETKFQVTPKFLLKVMNGIQQNQLQFAENMTSHVGAVQTLGKEVRGLGRAISKVIRENKDLKLKLKNQKTLSDY